MTTVSCIQRSLLLQRRISCVREMGKTTKWLRNIFSVWTLRFHLLLGTTCSAKTPLLRVPVRELRLILSLLLTRRCEISLLVATRDSWNMHERTHLHNLQSLAGCELIQCFYQSRFQWNARLKEKKKTWITNTKVSLPKIYFQTRQHWLTQGKLRWSKVFPSPKYRTYSKKPRGAYEIFGLVGKRLISGRREWG